MLSKIEKGIFQFSFKTNIYEKRYVIRSIVREAAIENIEEQN